MPKAKKPTEKSSSTSVKTGDGSVAIGGDVKNSQIVTNFIRQTIEKQLAVSLFTIPASVGDFTDREKELADLKAAFERGAIITGVTGGGGIGKTELARRLAQEIADGYPDARLNIDLLGTSENPLSCEEAMRRLLEPFYPNQKLPNEPEQLKGLFQQTFAAQHALLLLDNAANAAQVRALIPPAPSATIITSRLHFGLTEFGLNPLRLDVLSENKAVELLRTASLKLKEASDEEVSALATLCGHLPLALRVAASLLDDSANWTPSTLISRLKDERTRLGRLRRDNDHDLDVEATLSLSYQLLDDDLKKYFRLVSVFTAPFVVQSAKAVWGLEEDGDTLDLLDKLVNRSFLNFLSEGAGYYSLHDLTRFFGFGKLVENAVEAENVIMAHANHFLEWARWTDEQYQKGNENILLGLTQFRFIWPHLNTAYKRLLPEGKTIPRESADMWLSNFPAFCPYVLNLHLPPRQKIPILIAALEATRRLGEKQAEGVHLGNLGVAYADLGDARKAIGFYEQQLIIVREIGDRRGEGAALGNLGLAYADLGDARKAIEFYEQALLIDRETGDQRGESATLCNLGTAYEILGDTYKAIEFYEQALVSDREIGDRLGEGANLANLGAAHFSLSDVRKAIEFYEQALVIHQEISNRQGEGAILGNLGTTYYSLGDTHKAIEFYEQALVIHRKIGDRRSEGNALGNLGSAYATLGDMHKAIEFYEQAFVNDREIGDRLGEGATLGSLGVVYKNLGDVRKAIEFHEQALGIHREIGNRLGEGADLGNLGTAYYSLGDVRKAIEFYEQQLIVVSEIGDRRGEGNALANMGVAYKDLGEKDKANKLWKETLAIYRVLEDPHAELVEKWLADLDNGGDRETKGTTVQEFAHSVIQARRKNDPQAAQYFDAIGKMIRDENLPPEIRELAKALQKYMSGIKNPDLSTLPEELATLVREELEK